jgi:hypothetical protein
MRAPKIGGKDNIRVLVAQGEDVRDSLLSRRDGGRKLDFGLPELLHERYQGNFRVQMIEDTCGLNDLLHSNPPSRIFTEESDVLVLSLLPEITRPLRQGESSINVSEFKASFLRLVREMKERQGAHIIAYNCSTYDPKDQTSNYHNVEDTVSLRAHKFNLALIEISIQEGISIIDVDRLIADLSGEKHVTKVFSYSADACQAICREFVRVLEDIGFFEDRPLVPQLGQKRE